MTPIKCQFSYLCSFPIAIDWLHSSNWLSSRYLDCRHVVNCGSVFRSDNGHGYSSIPSIPVGYVRNSVEASTSANPTEHVGIVCFRIRARVIEQSFDRIWALVTSVPLLIVVNAGAINTSKMAMMPMTIRSSSNVKALARSRCRDRRMRRLRPAFASLWRGRQPPTQSRLLASRGNMRMEEERAL